MNATSIFGSRNPLRLLATVLLGLFILGQIPLRAAADSARADGQNDKFSVVRRLGALFTLAQDGGSHGFAET